jgi:tetratricopeptide (TPR) repeat protein
MYNVGGIYWRKDELDQAKNYLDQSLEIVNEFGNLQIAAKILLDLISINLDDFNVTKATKHFKELDIIDKQLKNKLVHQQTRFAEALIFMNSKDERDQGKAEILFEQIVEEEVIYHSLTVSALLNLCESLLTRFRETNKKDVLNSLNALVEKLLGISEQQKSVSLLAESYWLKYQLLILDDLKFEEAEIYLNKANQIAKEYDLTNLVNKFAKQKNIIDKGLRDILSDDKTIKIPVEQLPDHLKMMDSIKDLKKQSNVVVVVDNIDKKIWEFRIN